jgi:serine/threonine kinase PknH
MTWPPPPPSSDPWLPEPPAGDGAEHDPWIESADRHGGEPVESPPQPGRTEAEPDEPVVDPVQVPPAQPDWDPPSADTHAPPPATPDEAPDDSAYAGLYTAPPPVVPRLQPSAPGGLSKPMLWAGAAVAAIVVVGLVVWLLIPSSESDTAVTATSTAPTPTRNAAAESRLRGLLPAGYPADACSAATAPGAALAGMSCGKNADAGGPLTATYTLLPDAGALTTAFDDLVSGATILTCPGNIQSPGPWRRNATPDKVSGTLVCGERDGKPLVAWTTQDESLLSAVQSGPQGPNLVALYAWWASHS